MKLFYTFVLLLGICLAVVMQLVSIALPKDAYVASALSRSPSDWSVTLDDSLKSRLSHYEVKAELVTALQKRATFRSGVYSQSMWEGVALIALSVVGLVREKKIDRMKKKAS